MVKSETATCREKAKLSDIYSLMKETERSMKQVADYFSRLSLLHNRRVLYLKHSGRSVKSSQDGRILTVCHPALAFEEIERFVEGALSERTAKRPGRKIRIGIDHAHSSKDKTNFSSLVLKENTLILKELGQHKKALFPVCFLKPYISPFTIAFTLAFLDYRKNKKTSKKTEK